jgi:hypothetical protein
MTNRQIAVELLRIAKELSSAKTYELKRDVRTKKGEEFDKGTRLRIVSYDDEWESPRL